MRVKAPPLLGGFKSADAQADGKQGHSFLLVEFTGIGTLPRKRRQKVATGQTRSPLVHWWPLQKPGVLRSAHAAGFTNPDGSKDLVLNVPVFLAPGLMGLWVVRRSGNIFDHPPKSLTTPRTKRHMNFILVQCIQLTQPAARWVPTTPYHKTIILSTVNSYALSQTPSGFPCKGAHSFCSSATKGTPQNLATKGTPQNFAIKGKTPRPLDKNKARGGDAQGRCPLPSAGPVAAPAP